MPEYAAWALGVDQPGIVAAVTGALYEQGCNLEDTSMTILSGHFAIMLMVRAPDDVSAEGLEAALRRAGEPLSLTVAVRPVEAGGQGEADGDDRHIVAVYGADRPGIVHRVSTLLAERGVNITDLTTRVIGPAADPVYAMHLEVVLPGEIDADTLAGELAAVGEELGVDTSIHPVDLDVL
ncbi:MAG TPA: ACT domain-containing protein [Acidimicrobiia bacterium]|nr:ACT domain-containing protein [Acidimicrobiia bacterium]